MVLDRLKHNSSTRHIPVHVISVDDQWGSKALAHGAFACLTKPVSKKDLEDAFVAIKDFVGACRPSGS